MSKEAALRAMREEAYAKRTAGSIAAPRAVARAVRPAATKPAVSGSPADSDALCGHRSMNGRTCTREQGHAAKSHRYG